MYRWMIVHYEGRDVKLDDKSRRRGRNGMTTIKQALGDGECSSWRGDTTHTESLCELWFPLQAPDRLGIVDPLSRAFIRFEPSVFE